jgi:hypothetical protein
MSCFHTLNGRQRPPSALRRRHIDDPETGLRNHTIPALVGALFPSVHHHQEIQRRSSLVGRRGLDVFLDENLAVVGHGVGEDGEDVGDERIAIVVQTPPDEVDERTWF